MMNRIFILLFLLFSIVSQAAATVQFDTTDDSIGCGDSSIFDNLTSLTIGGWFLIDTVEDSGRMVVKWGINNTVGSERQLIMTFSGTEEFICGVREGTAAVFSLWASTGANLVADTWYHLACTWTADNTWVFYVDGSSVTSTVFSDSGTGVSTGAGATPFEVGRSTLQQAGNLDMDASDVALWSSVLTANEVAQLAKSKGKRMPLQISPSTLLVYLPLDEEEDGTSADGDTFRDLSNNGLSCTGSDGANNTGLTAVAETVLTYP